MNASLVFGLGAAVYTTKKNADESVLDALLDISRWTWDYTNTGLSITLNVTPSLSVGVGIRGVASISVKGAITLSLYLGIPFGTQPDYLPGAHFTAGWSAKITLVISRPCGRGRGPHRLRASPRQERRDRAGLLTSDTSIGGRVRDTVWWRGPGRVRGALQTGVATPRTGGHPVADQPSMRRSPAKGTAPSPASSRTRELCGHKGQR